MKILVVGNILKDVYLNIDSRTENFETDRDGVQWLNVGFDNSEHHFFRRNSCLGGATITLEVLQKMGIEAAISGEKVDLTEDGMEFSGTAQAYRYILVANEQISYLTSSARKTSIFDAPTDVVDYIFVDRSAELDEQVARRIMAYLDISPATRLILHVRKTTRGEFEKELIRRAAIVLAERRLDGARTGQIVYLDGFTNERENLLTHLSVFSIAAATIVGGLLTGKDTDTSLKMAKINVEGSSLDTTLSLAQINERL